MAAFTIILLLRLSYIIQKTVVMVEVTQEILFWLNIFFLQLAIRGFQIEERQETSSFVPPYRIIFDYIYFLIVIHLGGLVRLNKILMTLEIVIHGHIHIYQIKERWFASFIYITSKTKKSDRNVIA